jgi:hypothetical protein
MRFLLEVGIVLVEEGANALCLVLAGVAVVDHLDHSLLRHGASAGGAGRSSMAANFHNRHCGFPRKMRR